MFERWKKRHTLVDDVNIITKLILGVLLFILSFLCIILII